MNLLNRDFRQMKIAGQHTPFWGGQHGRFLQLTLLTTSNTIVGRDLCKYAEDRGVRLYQSVLY
ncbi:MAG: hypothetical protein RLZZ289_1495, partial [Bacteroidota bacterium]